MPSPTDMGPPGSDDPAGAVAALVGRAAPYLIGVRHHSPALAAVVPRLLDAYRPTVILLELPEELGSWLPWLADPGTRAPIALAGVVGDDSPAFYPFADFSPELAAIRWAAAHGVPVVPCDLPLADPGWDLRGEPATEPADGATAGDAASAGARWTDALRATITGRDGEDLWDRAVEARAPGSDPEAVRRAALAVGWAMRTDARTGAGIAPLDLCRERWMRRTLARVLTETGPSEAGPPAPEPRVAAVIGAFHAPVLHLTGTEPEPGDNGTAQRGDNGPPHRRTVATSLVPYTFALLDERSGYPAGIRDPAWQQSVLNAAGDPQAVSFAALATIVRVCAAVRAAGHPAGPAEAREASRLAGDLACLRGLPAPGRGELVEAIGSVLAHGEILGRGRIVARAMEGVMVGDARGELATGTPRSGLGPAVRDLLAALRLPGPGETSRQLRLDPLRSPLDRDRDVALHQLATCGVPYAESTEVVGVGGQDALTTRWQATWTPQTDAMLDVVGVRGVTLAQAAEGTLRARARAQRDAGGPSAADVVTGLADAARCGLVTLAGRRLAEVAEVVPACATLAEALSALALLDRVRLGHVPGLPREEAAGIGDVAAVAATVEAAAVRQLDGLAGSEEVADARALAALAQRLADGGIGLRLADALARLETDGTPLMAGAAGAVRVQLGVTDPIELGRRIASWVDNASTQQARLSLAGHLRGLLVVADALLHGAGDVLTGLLDRVEALDDERFLSRLPALRAGFAVLSPAARDRLLEVVDERLGGDGADDVGTVEDPVGLLRLLLADRAGRAALEQYGLLPPLPDPVPDVPEPEPAPIGQPAAEPAGPRELAPADRWRLLLGRPSNLGRGAMRYATALDELYGAGRGEGAAAEMAGRAGREASYPGVREWAEELSVLFGPGVREEVLARAADAGRVDAALLIDPESATPSVELLRTVLSLAGGMSETNLARLRPLVARIVAELTRALATRLRPALAGLTTPRPTYRPGGRLDLDRTLRANLSRSRRGEDGRLVLVPERPVFRSRARRGVDWRLVLVVDVSGSMETSVIWSAVTASVLAGVPALRTHFVAFSTEVVDLSDRVDDPLGLLLEVRVGGGTHIAAGLRHAQRLITVPSRTLVVVVSDFEEGYPLAGLLATTRSLVESGVTLLGCASLDDAGRPRYSIPVAGQLVAAGMPVAALSPLELARWVGDKVGSR